MRRFRRLILLTTAALAVAVSPAAAAAPAPESQMALTWVAVTTWLIETGGKRILVDGFLTRPAPFANRGDVEGSFRAINSDPAIVHAVVKALTDGDQRIDFILSGHAHVDHSLDIPMIAQLTGAKIIGSPSTCFQAEGEGIPAPQCVPVNGGEVIALGGAGRARVTLYVIHGNHSGEGDTPIHAPLELTRPIVVEPPGSVTGGIRPGVYEQMPNGGGTRAFLIKTEAPGAKPLAVSLETSGSAADFDQPIRVSLCVGKEPKPCALRAPGPTYPSPAANFAAAMRAAHLQRVDVMIGMSGGPPGEGPADAQASLTAKEASILRPRHFMPTHWNATPAPIPKGLDRPFRLNPGVAAWLAKQGVPVVAPRQFFDRWVLNRNGLRADVNHEVKAALGLPDVQPFPAGPGGAPD